MTTSFDTVAVTPSEFGSTPSTLRVEPSGSESLFNTRTETMLPGRVVTSSTTAMGFLLPVDRALMPMRTCAVARAPRVSMTE